MLAGNEKKILTRESLITIARFSLSFLAVDRARFRFPESFTIIEPAKPVDAPTQPASIASFWIQGPSFLKDVTLDLGTLNLLLVLVKPIE
jgi:hypothetical protein